MLWTTLMGRAMSRTFSWQKSARAYEQLYAELVGPVDQAAA